MHYRSHMEPLCRYCGKAIPKKTQTEYFGCSTSSPGLHPETPRSIEEASELLGGIRILQHRWGRNAGGAYVSTAFTWKGQSYVDHYFCKSTCAANFGRWVVSRTTLATAPYLAAERRQAKKKERKIRNA